MIVSDSYFCKGNTHKICQDYAAHSQNCVVISDGCSSAPDTDFGARLFVKAALRQMEILNKINDQSIDEFLKQVLQDAGIFIGALNCVSERNPEAFPLDSLAATLITATVVEDKFHIIMSGDGGIIIKYNDGSIKLIEVAFESNAPYYLKYKIQGEKEYLEKFPPKISIRETFIGPILIADKISHSILTPDNYWTSFEEPITNVKSIAITSDGLMDFVEIIKNNTQKTNRNIRPFELAPSIMNFKSYNGEFVYRRCHKLFKELDAKGCYNRDDFSIGVLANV